MSDQGPTTDSQEILIAKSPLGARLVLGARGGLGRDIAGMLAHSPTIVPAALGAMLESLGAGLWVWAGTTWCSPFGRREIGRNSTIRPAVLADFARFALPTPLPRNDKGVAS